MKTREILSRALRVVAVAGFLVFLVNFLAVSGTQLFRWLESFEAGDRRAELPNYVGVPWAATHFREFGQLTEAYQPYQGWRRRPFAGETINIDTEGVRRTWLDPAGAPTRTIAFFGGSTTWGTGADDAHTLPSMFARLRPEFRAYNFGESGHTAHQNLNFLIKQLTDGLVPDVVVFYNGGNDIAQCRIGLGSLRHVKTPALARALDRQGADDPESYLSLFYPAQAFLESAAQSVAVRFLGRERQRFDCHLDAAKAASIARALLWDWTAAKRLVEGYGGRFVAALQPTAFSSRTRTDHLRLPADVAAQYQAVYPLIVEQLERDFADLLPNFLDLRTAYDRDAYIFIDADHVSPEGNAIIAERISEHLAAPSLPLSVTPGTDDRAER
jgi:lysophospholipase L1-like esterase